MPGNKDIFDDILSDDDNGTGKSNKGSGDTIDPKDVADEKDKVIKEMKKRQEDLQIVMQEQRKEMEALKAQAQIGERLKTALTTDEESVKLAQEQERLKAEYEKDPSGFVLNEINRVKQDLSSRHERELHSLRFVEAVKEQQRAIEEKYDHLS